MGEETAQKIFELIHTNEPLARLKAVADDPEQAVIGLLSSVWGVGKFHADHFQKQGVRTLEDLRVRTDLNEMQRIGIDYHDDIKQHMPRVEVEKIGKVVCDAAKTISSKIECVLGGSYRRGELTSGDIDVMFCNDDDVTLPAQMNALIRRLKDDGFITADSQDSVRGDPTVLHSNTLTKFMGLCKLRDHPHHRRLDIIILLNKERAAGTIYFTGCTHFNREIRTRAERIGLFLDNFGLYDAQVVRDWDRKKTVEAGLEKDRVQPTPANEQEIFEILNMKFIPPHDRKVYHPGMMVDVRPWPDHVTFLDKKYNINLIDRDSTN